MDWEVEEESLGFGLREEFGESVRRRGEREVAESGHRSRGLKTLGWLRGKAGFISFSWTRGWTRKKIESSVFNVKFRHTVPGLRPWDCLFP